MDKSDGAIASYRWCGSNAHETMPQNAHLTETGDIQMLNRYQALRRLVVAAAVCLCASAAFSQSAASYPTRPIRLIVVFPPGGGTDTTARIVAPRLSDRLGQPVIVENKPGQGGGIGLAYVAKAPADGYTLVLASSGGLTALPFLYKNIPFNPEKDFAPITKFGISPLILVAAPGFEGNSLTDVIRLAKEHPGKLTFGSGGTGTATHLAGELLKAMTHTDIMHVPYKGSAPELTALMAGDIDLGVADMNSVRPLVKAGKLKAIGVLNGTRTATAPEIPTLAESGLPGYAAEGWFAVLAPAGTPQAIVAKLNAALTSILDSPEVREKFSAAGMEMAFSTPEQLTELIRKDSAKWGELIKERGITAD